MRGIICPATHYSNHSTRSYFSRGPQHQHPDPTQQGTQEDQIDAFNFSNSQLPQRGDAPNAHVRNLLPHQECLCRELRDQLHFIVETIEKLQQDTKGINKAIQAISQNISTRETNIPSGISVCGHGPTLELMAQQLATVSQKANEVDKLKIIFEIMKAEMRGLKEIAVPTSQQPQGSASQPLQPHPIYPPQPYAQTPPYISYINTPPKHTAAGPPKEPLLTKNEWKPNKRTRVSDSKSSLLPPIVPRLN